MNVSCLEKLREEKNLSRPKLALAAGLSVITIYRAEKGFATGLETWRKLATALGVAIGELTNGDVSLGYESRAAKFVVIEKGEG
jgi:transcriptional regulator with XRE-family HTH domain